MVLPVLVASQLLRSPYSTPHLVLVQTQSIEPSNSIHCTRHQNELSESTDRHFSRLSHVFPSSRMVVQEAGHRNALAPRTVQRLRLGAAQWRSQKACIELVGHLHRSSPILCKACASPSRLWRSRTGLGWAGLGISKGLALRMPKPLRSRS
jgi:hypothetical protein